MMRKTLPRALRIILPGIFLALAAPAANADEIVGARAPEFALRSLAGEYVSITAERGRVLLLNFWATWCPPCRDEMPALDALSRRYADEGLRVLAVASDSSPEGVREFLAETPVSYTVMVDTETRATRMYRVASIPMTFLIDRRGIVVRRYIGPQDWLSPAISALIEALLSASPEVGPEIPAARPAPELPFPVRKKR